MNTSYVPARFRPHTSTRDTLARPRLVARATSAPPLSAALTLITGPAGFGKTTLLCEIARHLAAGGWRTAWLNCSSADRDPEVFLESLSLSIQQAVPSLRLAPQSIEALGAGLHAAPFNIALHIDEYEMIASPALDAALESLMRVAPQNVRLFVAARPPAPSHFVALELDGLVRHVGAAELRFDDAEAQILLGAAPTDEMMTLVRRADGWPFVLQLARLNASTRAKGSEMSGALRIPRERLFQFLAAEVMSSLGEEVQDFVIQTSLLAVVGAPEAEALTGRGDCLALMRRLGSLEPIVLIEPEPYQVRFHPLLQEYLLSRLRERGPAVVADLQRRIAEHFARSGRTIEAVEHALAGELVDLAISIVENAGGIRYVVAHGVTQARALLDLLPEEAVRSRLRLRLMSIGCLADHQRGTDSSVQLEALEQQLEQGEFAAEHDAEAALDLEVARGIVNFVRLEHEVEPPDWQALQRATQRVRRLFCDDPRLWIAPMVTEIRRLLRHGSLARAATLIDDLIDLNERGHRLRGALDAWLHRAIWAQAKGELDLAAEVAGGVLGKCLNLYGHEASHEGQLGSAILGNVLYLRGDIEGALHHFRNLDVKQPSIQFEVYVARYVSRAWCEMATGQQALARERLEQAVTVASERSLPHLLALTFATQVELLADADVERAAGMAEGAQLGALWKASCDSECIPWQTRVAIARALVSLDIATARSAHALEIAATLEKMTRSTDRRLLAASATLLLARALLACGQRRQALEHVQRALVQTEGTGAARLLLEHGAEIVALVRQIWRSGSHPASSWAARVLDQNTRVELLTPRQRDILDQLAIRRTTKEIARHLGLSPETVKHHLKTIFERLEVSSREEAIAAIRRKA